MIARLIVAPAILLGFAFWLNQVSMQVTGETLIPEIIAVGAGYSRHADTTTAPVQLAQGQTLFW